MSISIINALLIFLTRVLPHPPNVTVTIAMAVYLSYQKGWRTALCWILPTIFISDVGLNILYGYPLVGGWSYFSYSGVLVLIAVGSACRQFSAWMICGMTPFFSFFYWCWTNLGVFFTSALYPHTMAGFSDCFFFALPFLGLQSLGDLTWMFVLNIFHFLPWMGRTGKKLAALS